MTDTKEKGRIVKNAHAGPTLGHFGVTRTRKRISERFYWKGMYACTEVFLFINFLNVPNCYLITMYKCTNSK